MNFSKIKEMWGCICNLKGRVEALEEGGGGGEGGDFMLFMSEWDDGVEYVVGNTVTRFGSAYVAILDHMSDTDDDEPGVGANWETYWELLVTGAGGAMSYQGSWTATNWTVGNVVTNLNSTYVATQDHLGGSDDDEPGVGANWSNYWDVIATVEAITLWENWTNGESYPYQALVVNNGVTYICITPHISGSDDDEPGVGANTATYWFPLPGGSGGGSSGFDYIFDTQITAADPGSGVLNLNHATLASATRLYISETDADAVSIAAYLATWDDSTSTIRGKFKMSDAADPLTFAVFNVTGSVTDNGGWDTFVIAHVVSNGTFTDGMPIRIEFFPTGDKGDTGATGGATIQTFQTLTDGATVTWTADGSVAENNAVVTLAGNRTLAMSGWTSGMKGVLRVIQDGTGGRTLTLPATSTVPDGGGGAVGLTTAGNAVDLLYVICYGTNLYHFIHVPNLT